MSRRLSQPAPTAIPTPCETFPPTKSPRRRDRVSTNEKNLGVHAKKHLAIRNAAERLQHNPDDRSAMAELCKTGESAVEASTAPRRRGQPVRLRQRAAALLLVYGNRLSPALRARVREALTEPLTRLGAGISKSDQSPYVRSHIAAMMIGVSETDLLVMCRKKATRRALGWPRPVGAHLLFLKATLHPNTSAACLGSLPADEPWPSSSWPDGWLS